MLVADRRLERRRRAGWLGAVSAPIRDGGGTPPGQPPRRWRSTDAGGLAIGAPASRRLAGRRLGAHSTAAGPPDQPPRRWRSTDSPKTVSQKATPPCGGRGGGNRL